jgi:hypothetical protein
MGSAMLVEPPNETIRRTCNAVVESPPHLESHTKRSIVSAGSFFYFDRIVS